MGTKTNPVDGLSTQGSDVVAWRRAQLAANGFDPRLAELLASDCRVDLHALIELVERGCPPDLAARILTPLADEKRPC